MKIKGHKKGKSNSQVAGLHGHLTLRWRPGQRERAEYRVQDPDLGLGHLPRENQAGHRTVKFTKGFPHAWSHLSRLNPAKPEGAFVSFTDEDASAQSIGTSSQMPRRGAQVLCCKS